MITPLLADAAPNADTTLSVFRDWAVIIGSLGTFGLYLQGRLAQKREKKDVRIAKEDQPLEFSKAPKRFNAALAEQQHSELNRRLNGHDTEIDSLWSTLRAEDENTRKELREYVANTNLSLGRIEGKLGTLPKEKS